MDYISLRVFFDNKEGAVTALLLVLKDARETDKNYSFGSLSASQLLSSGLLISGDAHHLVELLDDIPGSSLYYD